MLQRVVIAFRCERPFEDDDRRGARNVRLDRGRGDGLVLSGELGDGRRTAYQAKLSTTASAAPDPATKTSMALGRRVRASATTLSAAISPATPSCGTRPAARGIAATASTALVKTGPVSSTSIASSSRP